MRSTIYLFMMICLLNSGCKSNRNEADKFVKIGELGFRLDGKPYYFVGTNFWYGAYLGSKAVYGDRSRLIRELDQLSSMGVKNLRILAASENSEISNSLKPAFILAPGKYDEELLDGLDYLLSEMAKRDMHAVLFLNNFWEWSGGMGQYNAWANGGKIVDPVLGKASWPDFIKFASLFYSDTLANRYYHDYIKMITGRFNKYNNRAYKDEPAIMAWELANEPRGGELIGKDDDFCRWLDETCGFIHSLDKNHLVTTGSEGTVGCRQDSAFFLKSHASKNIDYLTFHLWAKNWGWFDAKNIEKTFPSTLIKALAYINLQVSLAKKLEKPIVMEEFGMERDSSKCTSESPVTARNKYYEVIFSEMLKNAMHKGVFAGSNFWGWGGEARPKHDDFIYKPGDPFMGDPPQEGQGLNSVYSTDSSTINIIKKFAYQLSNINN